MKPASRVMGILLVMMVMALPAKAETIYINTGALEWISPAGSAIVQMAGPGFIFSGHTGSGVFTPQDACSVPECVAGSTLSLLAHWVGLDLPGTATYGGVTYTQVGGLNSESSMLARWSGSLAIPTDFTGGVLTAPFQFLGQFYFQDPAGPLNLLGSGQTTLNFTPYPNQPGAFSLASIRYEFDAAPVPEPASMLLIGTGLAGLAAMRRRRRQGTVD